MSPASPIFPRIVHRQYDDGWRVMMSTRRSTSRGSSQGQPKGSGVLPHEVVFAISRTSSQMMRHLQHSVAIRTCPWMKPSRFYKDVTKGHPWVKHLEKVTIGLNQLDPEGISQISPDYKNSLIALKRAITGVLDDMD